MGRYLTLAINALKHKNYYQEEPFLPAEQAPPITTTNYEITKEDEARSPAKPDIIRARVINGDGVAQVSEAELCWHCSGAGQCKWAVCLAQDIEGRDVLGQCRSCLGTGHLTFSEGTACQ